MKDSISPEEKLLRLIRGQKKQGIKATPEIKSQFKNLSYALPKKLFSILPFFNFHNIILVTFVLSGFYLIIAFVRPGATVPDVNLSTLSSAEVKEEKRNPKVEVKPREYYLEGLKERQIFSSENSTETRRIVASGVNAEIVKDITLLGIVLGESPQAVIEDKKTEKTYYVTKGQFINELQVEDIQEGKIILNYNGQKLELYL
ncbi:MAG: hypothetical protein PHX21_13660 [bacterium]|nr:hypothetical protein [Candidatus Portnoybacteria bacterium]MDD5531059.1 hypothetical protein [bacterium]